MSSKEHQLYERQFSGIHFTFLWGLDWYLGNSDLSRIEETKVLNDRGDAGIALYFTGLGRVD
jgi:hypothetical protein